jgi:hypothetical protein
VASHWLLKAGLSSCDVERATWVKPKNFLLIFDEFDVNFTVEKSRRGLNRFIAPEDSMTEISQAEFAQKGEEIYKSRILPEISEEKLKGKLIAIDVETGKYFIDNTSLKAVTRAQKELPNKIFYVKRIGYRAVHKFHGVVKKTAALGESQ